MRASVRIRILAAALLAAALPAAALEPGEAAPDFLGRDRDGRVLSLAAHRGKPVIATFWASWCAPCMNEMPVLDTIQRGLGEDLVGVVAINWGESRERYAQALEALSGTALTLTRDEDGRIGRSFGVRAIPHLFVIDASGRVAFVHEGYSASVVPLLVEQLDLLLSESPP